MKWGRKPSWKILRQKIEPFEFEIYRTAEELDWSLRMYYITLLENGFTEEIADQKINQVFVEALRRAKEKHA